MIRFLMLLGPACFVGAIVVFVIADDTDKAIGVVPLLVAIAISAFLALRSMFHKARGFVSDARAFLGGDIQHARVLEVRDPKGIFNTRSEVVVELEAEDGTKRQFEREVPIPLPVAWSYRFGKRFVPGARGVNLFDVMAMELRREGLDVRVARPAGEADESLTAAT